MKGEKTNSKMKRKKKLISNRVLILTLALVLTAAGVVGGTLAWLTAKTPEVTNVFTTSDINVELTETKNEFKMIPGWTIEKDPVVTVKAGSEACWVFIKVEEAPAEGIFDTPEGDTMPFAVTFGDFIDYKISSSWTPLNDSNGDGYADDGVYYCKATDINNDLQLEVLGYQNGDTYVKNQVRVREEVTKEMMNALEKSGKELTLSFTAYAVQLWKTNESADDPATPVNEAQFTPEEAWKKVSGQTN